MESELFGWFVFGRDGGVAGRGRQQIFGEFGVGIAKSKANAAVEEIDEEGVGPVFGTVADGGVEDASLAVHARPSHGVGRTLITFAGHALGIERGDDMQVGEKSFREYHSSVNGTGE